ncbi:MULTISPECIES: indole-3-glycerol phosphate synthase TrpC [unclassified Robiginitalea]|jgi:indole-3-glycerol phosphate synthase|uniref:indole-3-glycerol phosphate synthase TrpC n=1 Tax=Robiginitalea TaxID=252306 RepID=UPI00234BC313|nr:MULTISPECIES: indole-3-glycerol phosphate synthase TrpC [unclassified Robiginitalea]MDC6354707.1 indole-3-glycerol phosphate synthase TrpC [Robiginitalea sp. PM2]MDC6374611.1 indole-3-glycerol phosphate synthase TrpC [Robiginitalea sp. SP8]
MNILDRIAATKREEIALKQQVVPEARLRDSALMQREPASMKASLSARSYGIIAEHKRRSPSRAVINQALTVQQVVRGYTAGGAGAVSVLTDGTYFGGSLEDLLLARAVTDLPLLRKEFILEPYQVLEARAHGADAILLIAALLEPGQIEALAGQAQELGMEVLLEVHDREELDKSPLGSADMIGVNNRNLKTFEVDLATSHSLAGLIPDTALRITESGLGKPGELRELRDSGYRGFLMGESFMKQDDPGKALKAFLKTLEA